jgi:hypothetical protein
MRTITKNSFVGYTCRGSKLSEFEVMNAEDKSSLTNWVYDHLKAELEVIQYQHMQIALYTH